MKLRGKIFKDGRFWIAECEALQASTQGRTKEEALDMISDWVQTYLEDMSFPVEAMMDGAGEFVMSFPDPAPVIGIVLERIRSVSGMSYEAIRKHLNAKSRNTYRQYETGEHEPGMEILTKLLDAVGYEVELKVVKKHA